METRERGGWCRSGRRARCDPSSSLHLAHQQHQQHTHIPYNSQEQYDAEKEEEFEDSEGNVLDRRTFEDLARQGLL